MAGKLAGQKLLQIWQWDAASQAESTQEEAIALCKRFGATGVLIKALDGKWWMGAGIDDSAPALRSLDQIIDQARRFHDAGLSYYLWGVARPYFIEEQTTLIAAIANTTGVDGFVIDTEPYAGFWRYNDADGGGFPDVGMAGDFMARIRAQAPAAFLVMQPDPRPARFDELAPHEWLPYFDAIMPQSYWADFGTEPDEEMMDAADMGGQYGKEIAPTISVGEEVSAAAIKGAVQTWASLTGNGGMVLWRMGTANAEQLAAFTGFDATITPEAPAPEPNSLEDIADIAQAVSDALTALGEASANLTALLSNFNAAAEVEIAKIAAAEKMLAEMPELRSVPVVNLHVHFGEPPAEDATEEAATQATPDAAAPTA